MKIHLIDGTYELFRSYFGAPPRQDENGMEIGATVGLMSSFVGLLRRDDVTHTAVAFDHVIESFRNEMFAGYKTGEGIEEELRAQFPLAEEAARALGIVVWPMVRYEADDAMAAGAARWADDPAVDQVVLCSPDKDLAQCVQGDRIVCLDRRREILLDADGVREKFGVDPESIPDWLALVGDTADGIPGIPRWGAKSSATVLARYRKIEEIPDAVEDWDIKVRGAATLAKNLAAQREDAMLYRRLATLAVDVPIEESLDDLCWRGPDQPALEALCARFGTQDLLDRIPPPF